MTNIDSPEGVDTGDIVGGVVGFCVGELVLDFVGALVPSHLLQADASLHVPEVISSVLPQQASNAPQLPDSIDPEFPLQAPLYSLHDSPSGKSPHSVTSGSLQLPSFIAPLFS